MNIFLSYGKLAGPDNTTYTSSHGPCRRATPRAAVAHGLRTQFAPNSTSAPSATAHHHEAAFAADMAAGRTWASQTPASRRAAPTVAAPELAVAR